MNNLGVPRMQTTERRTHDHPNNRYMRYLQNERQHRSRHRRRGYRFRYHLYGLLGTDCKAGVEELAKVKAENTALKDANASLYAELEETREQLRQVEADKSVAEIALDDKTDRFIPFMNERLAEARSRIVALEAELAERDSFEECDCPEEGRGWTRISGMWGCSYNHDSLVEKHWADVYHKVGDKSKKPKCNADNEIGDQNERNN